MYINYKIEKKKIILRKHRTSKAIALAKTNFYPGIYRQSRFYPGIHRSVRYILYVRRGRDPCNLCGRRGRDLCKLYGRRVSKTTRGGSAKKQSRCRLGRDKRCTKRVRTHLHIYSKDDPIIIFVSGKGEFFDCP